MVGPMLLLKMLHCKRLRNKTRKRVTGEPVVKEPSWEDASRKIITMMNGDEADKNICRVCLKEGSIPIYRSDMEENLSGALNTFGGIDVRLEDPHPKFLCETCNSLLQGAILFRKTAQESDEILKQPTIEDPPNNVDDDPADFSDDDIPLKQIENKEKKPIVHRCNKCNISFDTFKELDEHRLSEEHENMRKVCPYCQKSYAPLYYKKHLSLHTKGPAYMCDVCGKNFIMQGHFTRHRLTHFYKLPFNCSLCPYKGRFRESLKMHMRSHTGEKPYQCSECPSRFINKSNLNKHMLTHKEAKDFKCDSCGRRFYTKRAVELHYKVDHAGVKDHVCNICGKAFGYRKQMMKHELKVHKRAKLRSGRTPLYLKVESMQQQGQKIITES